MNSQHGRTWNQLVLFTFMLLCISNASASTETTEQSILRNVLTEYIVPAYTRLETKTNTLSRAMQRLCANPSENSLAAARNAFHQTVTAWSFIELLRVGPITSNNRVERFFFFPDRKSIGLRQVQAILAKQDKSVLHMSALRTRSVALQGLGALDYALFGSNASELGMADNSHSYRCHFAQAVSKNLNHIAGVVTESWQSNSSVRADWLQPAEHNPFFRTDKEAMNLILSTLIHGLEAVRDMRIGTFLRASAKRDRPKAAPLWRSDATMLSITASINGLMHLFTQSNIERLLPVEHRNIGNEIRFELRQSINTAQQCTKPVSNLLADPATRKKMEYLKLTLGFAIDRLNHEFASALGLAAGFSFADGD